MKKEIQKQLEEINTKLEKLTSLKYNFLLSIIKGVASAIGATIVFTIIVMILAEILKQIGALDVLNRILEVELLK